MLHVSEHVLRLRGAPNLKAAITIGSAKGVTKGSRMQQVKGVVARSEGAPVEVVTINVPDPGPGEAVVKVQACGVCHTDLHYREGGINDEFPFLLGHEAAGVVEAVGPDVTLVAPGDFVVLNWRAVCGQCRACKRGEQWYCFATHNAAQKMTLAEGPDAGTELSPALGIGAFAEKTLVAAGQCTPVNPAAQSGQGFSLAARGCGAWSEPIVSTVPSATAAQAACRCRASRSGGFITP